MRSATHDTVAPSFVMATREPTIRFFKGPTGHRVGYATHGSGPPLVCSAWWVSHLEEDWKHLGFRRFFGGLGEHFTVYRYDRPGAGLSDRERESVSLDDEAATLRALCDHAELERLSLFGLTCAVPPALLLAASQPKRIDKMVFFGAYLRGADVAPKPVREAVTALVRASWGLGTTMITDLFDPNLDAEGRQALSDNQRASASKDMAAKLLQLTFETDISEQAPKVNIPALVLHRKDDRAIPFAAGRELAATLPNATFQPLDGAEHVPWLGDVDAARDAVLTFLGVRDEAPRQTNAPTHALVRAGEIWTLTYEGESVHLKHARGLSDLAVLLASPGQEVHCGTLWSCAETAQALGQAEDPMLDEEALGAYRQRLRELEAELDGHTGARAATLRRERDALASELRAAVGLGGRKRALDATSERARKAVSARLRACIRKIAEALPKAGVHLGKRVITGVYCSYEPAERMRWVVR
jgi:pimeloyl-ACP methyl ester carboxylesterase